MPDPSAPPFPYTSTRFEGRTDGHVSGGLRLPPHSMEAEEYLLSSCLLDGADVIFRCLEALIRAESFYDTKQGIVFERLLDLYNRQARIDVSVVAEELKTSRQVDAV